MIHSVHVTVNISETEEKELVLKGWDSLDAILEWLKRNYPTMLSMVLVVSL